MDVSSDSIATFVSVTGADASRARFFLESAGGDLDAAIAHFFEAGGNEGTMSDDPVEPPRRAEAPPERVLPRQVVENRARDAPPARGAVGPAGTGRVAGFSDLARKDDGKSKFNELYTGGAGQSGIAVQGRPEDDDEDDEDEEEDEVGRLFSRVQRHGARAGTSEDLQGDGRAPVFTGRAHTLAGSSRDTQAPRSAVKRYVVVFYANGVFTVDDGPARSVEDPANMGFIVAISRGERPRELKPDHPDQEVEVSLVRRAEPYVPPKEPVAFQGKGNKLGGDAEAAPVAQEAVQGTPGDWPGADDSKPKTRVNVRLADGSRLVAEFNLDQTVADIRRFVVAVRPQLAGTSYRLLVQDVPPRALADDRKTIAEEKLENACVMQR